MSWQAVPCGTLMEPDGRLLRFFSIVDMDGKSICNCVTEDHAPLILAARDLQISLSEMLELTDENNKTYERARRALAQSKEAL